MTSTWDKAKQLRNLKQHGIDLADLDGVFDWPMVSIEDCTFPYGEQRIKSLGWYKGAVVVLIWTERNGIARLISCRYGDKDETRNYFEAIL